MFIYIFQSPELGAFKIGVSGSPVERIKHLSQFYPVKADSVVVFNMVESSAAYAIENALKAVFAKNITPQPYDAGTEFFCLSRYSECLKLLEDLSDSCDGASIQKSPKLELLEPLNDIELRRIAIGGAVKNRRIDLAITQKQLSDLCKIGKRTLERFENGDQVCIDVFLKVATAIDLNVDHLLHGKEAVFEPHHDRQRVSKQQTPYD